MSRWAVSCEHLASLAHFDEVSLPSSPSSKRLTTFRCRSLSSSPACSCQNRAFRSTTDNVASAFEGTVQAAEKPLHPCGNVERALLGLLQDAVIIVSFDLDLGGHAVEPFRALLRACKRQVGDCTGDSTVAIIERVDGHEPEMGQRGFDHGIVRARPVEPDQKLRHLGRDPLRRRRW